MCFYWGLTRRQQPRSYRGGHDDGEMSVSLVEETGVPGGNHKSYEDTTCHQPDVKERQEGFHFLLWVETSSNDLCTLNI